MGNLSSAEDARKRREKWLEMLPHIRAQGGSDIPEANHYLRCYKMALALLTCDNTGEAYAGLRAKYGTGAELDSVLELAELLKKMSDERSKQKVRRRVDR